MRHADLLGLSLGVDASGFSNGYTEATNDHRKAQWLRLMGRFELGRHAYLGGDLEYDQGDDLDGPSGLFEAGWIF